MSFKPHNRTLHMPPLAVLGSGCFLAAIFMHNYEPDSKKWIQLRMPWAKGDRGYD
jgi:hypothetical protein